MSDYVLALLGVVVLGVVIEIILPNGEMNKYIRAMYSIFVVFIIISPISVMLKNGFNISDYINDNSITVDGELLDYIYTDQVVEMKKFCESELKSEGFSNIVLKIDIEKNVLYLKIKVVYVDIKNLVIVTDKPHINKYDEIAKILKKILKIKEEQIIYNE